VTQQEPSGEGNDRLFGGARGRGTSHTVEVVLRRRMERVSCKRSTETSVVRHLRRIQLVATGGCDKNPFGR